MYGLESSRVLFLPPAEKTSPAKATAPAKKAPSKKTAPAKATAPAKKAAPAKTAASTTQKTPAKKAPAKKALAVREDESAWTKAELAEVVKELDEQAVRLHAEVADQESELDALMRDAGDGAGHDQADMGATSFERDHELTLVANSREMIAQIERALARIEDGTYGVCESCGNPIGKQRLMAFPRATLCMTCKQREEKQLGRAHV